jgi:hypothetical protein
MSWRLELCVSDSPCYLSVCNKAVGCSLEPKECAPLSGDDATCYRVYCDEEQGGCIKETISNARTLNGTLCICFPPISCVYVHPFLPSGFPLSSKAATWATLSTFWVLLFVGLVIASIIAGVLIIRKKRIQRLTKREKYTRLGGTQENELYEEAYGYDD